MSLLTPLRKLRGLATRSPVAERMARKVLMWLRQWPFIWPRGLIVSAKAWLHEQDSRTYNFERRRTGWYQMIYPAEIRVHKTKPHGFQAMPPTFRPERVRKIAETGVFCLPNSYIFGDEGAVLSCSNALFDEFVHTFQKPILSSDYFRAFHMFSANVPRRSEWIALLAAPSSSFNYYHWIFDVLPRTYLLQRFESFIELYALPASLDQVRRDTLAGLAIDERRILPLGPREKIFCEHLLVPSLPGSQGCVPNWVIRFLHDTFVTSTNHSSSVNRRVYIRRGEGATRPILNENDVIDFLSSHGFDVASPEKMKFHEQVELFSTADILVSAHGAALTNLVFCKAGASLVELFSPHTLQPDCYYTLSDQCGVKYRYIVSPTPTKSEPWGSQRVDMHLLKKTLNAWAALNQNFGIK